MFLVELDEVCVQGADAMARRMTRPIAVSLARALACLALAVLSGCVAQVRGTRVQKPFTVTPAGTQVTLISVDVPGWVASPSTKEDVQATVKAGITKAFQGTAFTLVDETAAGKKIPIGPRIAPIIIDTNPGRADVGVEWPVMAMAVGQPPITWKVASGPSGFKVDAETGKISWTPRDAGKVKVELVASNPAGGETKWPMEIEVAPAGKEPVVARKPGTPSVGPDVEFASVLPPGLPGAGPLLMGAQVFFVGETTEAMPGGSTRPKMFIDAIYTLWTRDGREVETRRVQLSGVPNAPLRTGLKLVPKRSHWLSWDDDQQERMRYASMDKAKLFVDTVEANAAAFLYPYGERKVMYSAQLDESTPDLKPGIELSNKDDFEAAFKAFEEVSAKTPTNAGAFYNMGVMREVQGRDEEAVELYKKAVSLKDAGLYTRQLEAVESRVKNRTVLELK